MGIGGLRLCVGFLSKAVREAISDAIFLADLRHCKSSERAIRMAKVKQKISGGFRGKGGADPHADHQKPLALGRQTKKNQQTMTLSAKTALKRMPIL